MKSLILAMGLALCTVFCFEANDQLFSSSKTDSLIPTVGWES